MSRDDRRRSLLDAAEAVIEREGVGACSFEAVALDAGVAKTLPYAYFDSLEDLLVTVFDDVIGTLDAAIEETVRSGLQEGASFGTLLERSLAHWFDAVSSRGRLLAALLDAGGVASLRGAVRARGRRSQKLWHDVAVDVLHLDDVNAHLLSSLANRGATGLIDLWVRRRGSREGLTASYVAALEAAAAALRTR